MQSGRKKCHQQDHVYPSDRGSLKKLCHDTASAFLNMSSEKESEEQINSPQNVPLESTSDDEWSSDND